MRNIALIAGVAVLLFGALVAYRDLGPQRMAQPQPIGEEMLPGRSPVTMEGLPGITDADPYPDGCVDCHRKGDARDSRLSTIIARLAEEGRHPDVAERTSTEVLPDSCAPCHGPDASLPLAVFSHRDHYQGDDNVFITRYEGECLHCHSLDREKGMIEIKSGQEKDTA
ncbi:MAG: hypothetical protein ACOYD6_04770 [Limnochordia bacterium]|jgi:hypothetical protein